MYFIQNQKYHFDKNTKILKQIDTKEYIGTKSTAEAILKDMCESVPEDPTNRDLWAEAVSSIRGGYEAKYRSIGLICWLFLTILGRDKEIQEQRKMVNEYANRIFKQMGREPIYSQQFSKGIFPLQNAVRHPVLLPWSPPRQVSHPQQGGASCILNKACAIWLKKTKINQDWYGEAGKVKIPRQILASFLQQKDLEKWNKFLQKNEPRGTPGTRISFLNPRGDYDFTLTTLTSILWKFGNEPSILYEKTKKHLLNTLLTLDGGEFSFSVPNTLGVIGETENHMLMIAGSRYLKNRWMKEQEQDVRPEFDNIKNGLEAKVLGLVDNLRGGGLFEFNSRPYYGYTLLALHNLAEYGSANVKKAATQFLDELYMGCALGSLWTIQNNSLICIKEYPPFQRKEKHAKETSLSSSYANAFLVSFLAKEGITIGIDLEKAKWKDHLIDAVIFEYQLPQAVIDRIRKTSRYFAKIGHGQGSCPEIYTAGSNFLLSAGGVRRSSTIEDPQAEIITRPIALFLNDDAKNIDEVIHLRGKGRNFKKWNNTGVYQRFACSAGKTHIPTAYQTTQKSGDWNLYQKDGLLIASYQKSQISLLVVLDTKEEFKTLAGQTQNLGTSCDVPGIGVITYDLKSREDKYVICSVNGLSVDRNIDRWPRMEVADSSSISPPWHAHSQAWIALPPPNKRGRR